jgi:hypothetical protein
LHAATTAFTVTSASGFILGLARRERNAARVAGAWLRSRRTIVRRRRQIIGLGETPLITFDESIEQPVTILFPGTPACHEIDGAQEPYISTAAGPRAESFEVIEPPCILRYRNCSTCASPCNRTTGRFAQITAQIVADPRDPGPVDEPEIIVRVGSKSLDQLGRRAFEGFRLGSERPRTVRRSHHATEITVNA